jgi:hypothetical protein
MTFLLGAPVLRPLVLTQLASLGFRSFEEHCSARGFCDSRQARSNGLPRPSLAPPDAV